MEKILPFLCTRCLKAFGTKGELTNHKCFESSTIKGNTIKIVNPIVMEADKEAVIEEKEQKEEIADATEKVEKKIQDDETNAINEKLSLMGMDESAIKDYGKANGTDKRKLNNKSKEEMIDIILANKKD